MLAKRNDLKYLVSNATDELWGLYATTLGFQSISPSASYPPREHPSSYWFNPKKGRILHEYGLIYIIEGGGMFESKHTKPTAVSAGSLMCLFPDEWHTYQPDRRSGWDEYWIGFNGRHMDELLRNNFFSISSPILNVGFNEQIIKLITQGMQIADTQKMAHQQALAGIISHLLGLLIYTQKNNAFRDKDLITTIEHARMIMMEDHDHQLSPEAIAKSLNMSYSWFRRVFRQYTGFSPAQYQMEIIMQRCKEMLTSTTMPIKEISYELNFQSISYFVTFFKSKTGVSPTEYRNKIQGKKKQL